MVSEKRPIPVPGKPNLTHLFDTPGAPTATLEIQHIAVDQIDESDRFRLRQPPYPNLESLVQDIREKGQSTPLFVRPKGDDSDRWELISGYRRLAALKQSGLQIAICRIYRVLSDSEAYDLAISENQERDNLTDIERAEICVRLQDQGRSIEAIAKRMGWASKRWVYEHLKLAKNATPELRTAMQNRRLSLRVALDVLEHLTGETFPDDEKRKQLLDVIIEDELSGRKLQMFLLKMKNGANGDSSHDDERRGYIREFSGGAFAIAARIDPRRPEEFESAIAALQDALHRIRTFKRRVEKEQKLSGDVNALGETA